MHKEEAGKEVKALFGEGTASEYLNYFTSRFPRLMLHCYSAVEMQAEKQFAEYIFKYQEPLTIKNTPGVDLHGTKLIIKFKEVTIIPATEVECDTLEIIAISHLFIEQNKTFYDFLQENAKNFTQLEFNEGSLKFDSMNKILQKLPNIKTILFDEVEYETPKTNQSIKKETCKKLVELKIIKKECSNLVQAFMECTNIQKLKVQNPAITLEEILQKFPKLKEFKVELNEEYPESNGEPAMAENLQMKVLEISLSFIEERIEETVFTLIQNQNKNASNKLLFLESFSFFIYNNITLSTSFKTNLTNHIFNMSFLTSFEIEGKVLLEGTGLIDYLKTSIISIMKVRNVDYGDVKKLNLLNVPTLEVFHIEINSQIPSNAQSASAPIPSNDQSLNSQINSYDDLDKLLRNIPTIKDLKIELKSCSPQSDVIELIRKVLTVGHVKRFELLSKQCDIKENDISTLTALLEQLECWKINELVKVANEQIVA